MWMILPNHITDNLDIHYVYSDDFNSVVYGTIKSKYVRSRATGSVLLNSTRVFGIYSPDINKFVVVKANSLLLRNLECVSRHLSEELELD